MEVYGFRALLSAVTMISFAAGALDIRLVDGDGLCSGRPEVLYEGRWMKVCSFFDFTAAMEVCRVVGCGNPVSVGNGSRYHLENLKETGILILCEAPPSTTAECKYNPHLCFVNLDVICSDAVRLMDGTGLCLGRVEVKTSQSWSTVCKTDFDWQDAEVLCREVGCGPPLSLKGIEGQHSFGTKRFHCKGTENHLSNCSSTDKEDVCIHGGAARLTCSGPEDLRLVNGKGRCAGIVEMFHGGRWRPLRPSIGSLKSMESPHLFLKEAVVVCRQLGCGSALSATWRKSSISDLKLGVFSACKGSESALRECRILFGGEYFISEVNCSDSVRLVDGVGFCSGRVEVKTNQSWAKVCQTDLDSPDAEVVCREVGCGVPLPLQGALFGEGEQPFETRKFQCNGTEMALLDCSASAKDEMDTCTNGHAVGLRCSEPEDVRMVDEGSRCAGTVQMFHKGEWMRLRSFTRNYEVEKYSWSMKEVAVVCRQLGCGSAVAAAWKTETVSGLHVNCEGSESALRECSLFTNVYKGGHGGVICSGNLVQPSIFFSPSTGASKALQEPQVFRGQSFTITCSTEPQFAGGSFHLTLPRTNKSLIHTAVNHSASFLFPTADDSHQGNYSCTYKNQVIFQGKFWTDDEEFSRFYIHNFSSKSAIFSLTVTDSQLNKVITRMLVVPFLLMITCCLICLATKKLRHLSVRSSKGNKRVALSVLYEKPEMVSLQSGAEEQQKSM